VTPGDKITKADAERMLEEDLRYFENSVGMLVQVKMCPYQQDALLSFAFNVGIGSLKSSTLLKKINAGASETEIRKEFERWSYAGGRWLKGLNDRRKAEADLYFK